MFRFCRQRPGQVARVALASLILSAAAPAALAESVSGVCPDGSMFIVQHRSSAPCANPRFVNATEIPPIRPEYMPHPYTWEVDQKARNPNNPYNLLEAARKIRAAHAARSQDKADRTKNLRSAPETSAPLERTAPAPEQSTPGGASSMVALSEDEMRDLVRLVSLRQEAAPAQIAVEDVRGHEILKILISHSHSFESLVLGALGEESAERRVLAFTASAPIESEFHPNFFVTQSGKTFRPDPLDSHEVAFLVGEAGLIPEGALALGYFVIPAHFDLSQPISVWWNDRSVETLLIP